MQPVFGRTKCDADPGLPVIRCENTVIAAELVLHDENG